MMAGQNSSSLPSMVQVRTHALDPMRADIHLEVPWPLEPGSEVRGRLMGPHCSFSSTVEVAYPWRPLGPSPSSTFQLVIPEPSLWEPACPFLYEGPVEHWCQGKRRETVWITHGLRNLSINSGGLLLNGHRFHLCGRFLENAAEADLLKLREKGYNTFLTLVHQLEIRALATRLGFILLQCEDNPLISSPNYLRIGVQPPTMFFEEAHGKIALVQSMPVIWGIHLQNRPEKPLPADVSFLLVSPNLVKDLENVNLPKVVLSEKGQEKPGIMGWIDGFR